jgi:hypothetical protein
MLRLPRSPFPPHTGIEFVKVNNIVYCQAENTYAYIHTSLNETILVTRTLKAVEEMLPGEYVSAHPQILPGKCKLCKIIQPVGRSGYRFRERPFASCVRGKSQGYSCHA